LLSVEVCDRSRVQIPVRPLLSFFAAACENHCDDGKASERCLMESWWERFGKLGFDGWVGRGAGDRIFAGEEKLPATPIIIIWLGRVWRTEGACQNSEALGGVGRCSTQHEYIQHTEYV
jgi:hypothetical protein